MGKKSLDKKPYKSIFDESFVNRRENPTEEPKPIEELIDIHNFRLTTPIDEWKEFRNQEKEREESHK